MNNRCMQRPEYTAATNWLGKTVIAITLTILNSEFAHSQNSLQIEIPPSLASLELPTATQNDRVLLQRSIQLLEQQPSEALQTVLRVMESDQGKVIYTSAFGATEEFHRYVNLRQLCQRVISQLPVSDFQAYRNQVDPLAREQLELASANRDIAPLLRIIREWPQSSHAGPAALLLGDLAFVRGRVGLAREFWLSLLPEALNAHGFPLALFADSVNEKTEGASQQKIHNGLHRGEIDTANVVKRLILCELESNRIDVANRYLSQFTNVMDKPGLVLGQAGNLKQLLSAQIEVVSNQVSSESFDAQVDLRLSPAWVVDGAPWQPDMIQDLEWVSTPAGIESENTLFFNNLVGIYACDSRTGKGGWSDDYLIAGLSDGDSPLEETEPYSGRFVPSVSIDRGLLIARLGSPVSCFRRGRDPATVSGSVIVALDLESQGLLLPGFPIKPPSVDWCFDGNPLLVDGELFVVLRKNGTVRSDIFVASYDIDNGMQKWIRQIGSVNTRWSGRFNELNQPWLQASARGVIVCTNLGIVARLSRETGEINWITTYPHDAQRIDEKRKLTTGFVEHEFAVVAPGDSDAVFCIECQSGRIVWFRENEELDATSQISGVYNGDVILSGKQLVMLDFYSGKTTARFPTQINRLATVNQFPTGTGRAIIAGDELAWPTNAGLFILDKSIATKRWSIRRVIDFGQNRT